VSAPRKGATAMEHQGKSPMRCRADLLRAMGNSAAEGIIAVSPEGDLFFYNAGARCILGTGFVHHGSEREQESCSPAIGSWFGVGGWQRRVPPISFGGHESMRRIRARGSPKAPIWAAYCFMGVFAAAPSPPFS